MILVAEFLAKSKNWDDEINLPSEVLGPRDPFGNSQKLTVKAPGTRPSPKGRTNPSVSGAMAVSFREGKYKTGSSTTLDIQISGKEMRRCLDPQNHAPKTLLAGILGCLGQYETNDLVKL